MGKTATISVRVDELDKQSAEQVLKQLGMPISTLVTLLLKQVSLTKKIPFDIALPDVPSSVNVEEMTAERFGQMMVEAYHYIADELQSPETAMNHFEAIAEGIKTLEIFPERCAIVEELLSLDIKVRRLLVKNYSVFYRFDKDTVTILRVLHQSSSLDRLLFEIGNKSD